jgi:hypothetical protein
VGKFDNAHCALPITPFLLSFGFRSAVHGILLVAGIIPVNAGFARTDLKNYLSSNFDSDRLPVERALP